MNTWARLAHSTCRGGSGRSGSTAQAGAATDARRLPSTADVPDLGSFKPDPAASPSKQNVQLGAVKLGGEGVGVDGAGHGECG